MTGPVTLAVVVCTRDRPDRLRRCLASLADQPADDVIVVDSASRADDTQRIANEFAARCVRVEQPGLAKARNAGVRAARHTLIAFTDDDCTASPGWTTTLRAAAADDAVGFVLGRVLPGGDGPAVSVHLDERPRVLDHSPETAGHGANLAVRRSCWEDIGGFDELLGAGAGLRSGEDTDFLWRAHRAGWYGRYEPAAVVVHEQWRGRLAALRTSFGYGVGAGAVRTKARRLGGTRAVRWMTPGSVRATARQALQDARAGYPFGVAMCLTRAAGIAAGRNMAAKLPIDHGHFQQR